MLEYLSGAGSILSGLGSIGGLFGGSKGPKPAEQMQLADVFQRNLMRDQLPIMAESAKNAGFHPLVGAGINPATSSAVGGVVGDSPSTFDKLADAGQNISRAASALGTKDERAKMEVRDSLLLEKMKLENDLLRSQISHVNRPITPPVGGDALGSNQGAEYGPVGLNTPTGPMGSKEGGATTDFTYTRSSNGGLNVVPSADVKNRIEDMLIPELQWSYRNTHILKNPPYPDPKQFPVPAGYDFWKWSPGSQQWKPYKRGIFRNMNPFN